MQIIEIVFFCKIEYVHLQPFQFNLCCVCLCFCAGSSLPEEGMLQFLLACFVAASQAGLTGRPVWWRNQWWMEETETGWYVPCSRDGEWVFDDHMGWLSSVAAQQKAQALIANNS